MATVITQYSEGVAQKADNSLFEFVDVVDNLLPLVLFIVGWRLFGGFRRHLECSRPSPPMSLPKQQAIPIVEQTAAEDIQVIQEDIDVGLEFQPVQGCAMDMNEDWPDFWETEDRALTRCPSDQSFPRNDSFWFDESPTNSSADLFADYGDKVADATSWGMSAESTQSAMDGDMDSALAAALVSGDAGRADSILATGAHLCGTPWLTKACGQLRASGIRLTPDRASEFVDIFAREQRGDLAVDLWVERCMENGKRPADCDASEPIPEADLYAVVLEACASAGDFEAAARAARSAKWRAPSGSFDQHASLALVRWLARQRSIGPALSFYESIRAEGTRIELSTHRTLLKACVSSNDMTRADLLFQELVDGNVTLDFATFAAMIRGHRAAGRLDEAMSYFELMKLHGIQPDASLFDAVLDGCVWRDVPALVEQVLSDMDAAGVKPSNGTLAIILKLYGQSAKMNKALEAFKELPRRHGIQLDGSAYAAMISTCLQNGCLDLALETFQNMSAVGFRAKARIYDALLNACIRAGRLDSAVHLVDDALSSKKEVLEDENNVAEQQPVRPPLPRARLEPPTVEKLLRLIGKRGEAARLGVPLLARLRQVSFEVPQAVAVALATEAQSAASAPSSTLHQRREVHNAWRDFRNSTHSSKVE